MNDPLGITSSIYANTDMVFFEAVCPSKQHKNEHVIRDHLQISLLILSDFKQISFDFA